MMRNPATPYSKTRWVFTIYKFLKSAASINYMFPYPVIVSFIIVFGILTSWEDIKHFKIPNYYILFALLFALLENASYAFTAQEYFISFMINAVISLLAGYALWVIRVWTAADGKLFFAYSAMIPLSVYYLGYVRYFPSMIIMINTFIPIFVFLVLNLLVKTSIQEKIMMLKKTFSRDIIINMFLIITVMSWFVGMLFSFLHVPRNFFLSFLVIFSMFFILRAKLGKNFTKTLLICLLVRIILDYQTFLYFGFWIGIIKTLIFFLLAVFFVFNMGVLKFNTDVNIKDLKPGMLLSEIIVKKDGKYSKSLTLLMPTRFAMLRSLIERVKESAVIKYRSSGLTREDIKKIQQLKKEGKLDFDHLLIQQAVSFAPFLFLGVLLTIILKGSIISYVKIFIPYVWTKLISFFV
ncbi:MAG: hypothetical protein B6U68_01905 [Candidatus Aenigmarchaeota archaeon ex4484_14]|nr:MAG: hypothetical protein B6U68_01905 [Candidatus Aenigmarchaeota archaeon ex4484_14]